MYIGKIPATGAFQKCDAISVVNGQAAYTLQVGSTNVSPESVNHMIVSLNGVIQAPTTAYTVAGAVLTFDSNLATGDVIDFVLLLGNVLDIGTVSDNTVATAKIQDDAVTLAKMAAGTDGNIISYDASGNPVAIATGSDGQVLTSTGAGSPPAFEAAAGGSYNLIKTLTASSDSTLSLVDGTASVVFDNTYAKYVIDFYDIKPATDNVHFEFNGSIDAGSNYNVTKTSMVIEGYNSEGGSLALQAESGKSLEQSTDFQNLAANLGNGADESASGTITIWNPSGTTNVKHFQAFVSYYQKDNYAIHYIIEGYMNTTDDVDALQFKMSSGNIASGVIKLYGVT